MAGASAATAAGDGSVLGIPLQAAPPAGGGFGDPSFLLMLGSIFFIFYFLVIRPENKRRSEHDDAVKGAAKGDTVVTSGGIQGRVTGTTDDVVTLEIATLKNGERIRIKVMRSGIQSVTKASAGGGSES